MSKRRRSAGTPGTSSDPVPVPRNTRARTRIEPLVIEHLWTLSDDHTDLWDALTALATGDHPKEISLQDFMDLF